MTIEEIAETIIRMTGSTSQIVYRPLPTDDPKQRRPDITRARTLLGWEPKVQLEEGLVKTIEYFRTQGRLVSRQPMELFQVDDDGRLFISPAIENWDALARYQIDTVIDLEGGLDTCIPNTTNHCLYIYFPIDDDNETAAEHDQAARDRAARRDADRRRAIACCRTAGWASTARRSSPG